MYDYNRSLTWSVRVQPLRLFPSLSFPIFERSDLSSRFEVVLELLWFRVSIMALRWISLSPLGEAFASPTWPKEASNDSSKKGR